MKKFLFLAIAIVLVGCSSQDELLSQSVPLVTNDELEGELERLVEENTLLRAQLGQLVSEEILSDDDLLSLAMKPSASSGVCVVEKCDSLRKDHDDLGAVRDTIAETLRVLTRRARMTEEGPEKDALEREVRDLERNLVDVALDQRDLREQSQDCDQSCGGPILDPSRGRGVSSRIVRDGDQLLILLEPRTSDSGTRQLELPPLRVQFEADDLPDRILPLEDDFHLRIELLTDEILERQRDRARIAEECRAEGLEPIIVLRDRVDLDLSVLDEEPVLLPTLEELALLEALENGVIELMQELLRQTVVLDAESEAVELQCTDPDGFLPPVEQEEAPRVEEEPVIIPSLDEIERQEQLEEPAQGQEQEEEQAAAPPAMFQVQPCTGTFNPQTGETSIDC